MSRYLHLSARQVAETLEQVRLIRALGFDSIWAGEHHVTPGFHFFPQFALLQRVASEAEGLWIGTNLALLPLHNPVELAERLTGLEEVNVIERDGSPAPARRIAVWNPPLTDRELGVLRLIADGRTNREIATELFLAEGTVKNHVTNVLAKLNVRDRTQAALRARALGLL